MYYNINEDGFAAGVNLLLEFCNGTDDPELHLREMIVRMHNASNPPAQQLVMPVGSMPRHGIGCRCPECVAYWHAHPGKPRNYDEGF